MPKLIAALVRHGDYHQLPDTPSAHQPFPLNLEGERQAQTAVPELNRALQEHGWTLVPSVDSSRMLRGWQTACIIAAGLSHPPLPVESFDALAERGMGSAANLSVQQIEAVLSQDPRFDPPPSNWKADSHYCLPLQGAESLLGAGERVAAHVQRRMDALRDTVTEDSLKLFIGHGAAFRHAAYHLGVLKFGEIAQLSMYHCQPVFLEALPDGGWRHAGGEWKVRTTSEAFID